MAPRKRYGADIALAALAAVVAADGCNHRRSRTGPGQFFAWILRASLRLWEGPADLAGFVRILRVSWGSARLYQLGGRAAIKTHLLTRDFGTCIKRYHKIMLSLANQSTTYSGRAFILPISRVTSLCVFFVKGLPDGPAF